MATCTAGVLDLVTLLVRMGFQKFKVTCICGWNVGSFTGIMCTISALLLQWVLYLAHVHFFWYFIHASAFGTGSSSHTFILTGLTISLRSCWSDCAHYKALMYRTSRDPVPSVLQLTEEILHQLQLAFIYPQLLACVVFPHILSIFAFKIEGWFLTQKIFRVPKNHHNK